MKPPADIAPVFAYPKREAEPSAPHRTRSADLYLGETLIARLKDVEWETAPGDIKAKLEPANGIHVLDLRERVIDSATRFAGRDALVRSTTLEGGADKPLTLTATFVFYGSRYGMLSAYFEGFTLTPEQLREWKRRTP